MNLIIDLGNTHAKLAVFASHRLLKRTEVDVLVPPVLKRIAREFPEIKSVVFSSVIDPPASILQFLRSKYEVLVLNSSTALPFKNRYKTPETLGADRLASVAGAAYLFPRKNVLVIDAGTCLKYNFINSKGEFSGGGISPGLRMRFKALNNFTARLPLVKIQNKAPLMGGTTEASILSGVINGTIEEVKGMASQYRKKYIPLKILLTGGDAGFFEDKLKISTFASPDLILIGLNVILEYNAGK